MKVTVQGLQAAFVVVGTACATILVFPAAWMLLRTNLLFGIAMTTLIAGAMTVCWRNALGVIRPIALDAPATRWWERWLLLGAFPASLYGSAIDCSGFRGCTPICGFLDTRVLPVLVAVTLVFLLLPRPWILLALTSISFALLVPSCRCYNPVNRPWIDLIGLSPSCFGASFTVGIMAVGALVSRRLKLATAVVGWGASGAELFFAVSHHQHHWPW